MFSRRLSATTARAARPLDENAGIHGLEVASGATDLQPHDRGLGGQDRYDAAGAVSLNHRAWGALQDDAFVQRDRPGMNAGLEDQNIALGRGRNRLPQFTAAGRYRPLSRPDGTRHGESHSESGPYPTGALDDHVDCGSTSRRPRISMCMAWQNQVQKYQWTPGRSATKVTEAVA